MTKSEPSASGYVFFKGVGKTMWLVVDTDGDTMRFYSKRECEVWIARAEASAVREAEYAKYDRIARLERIHTYLQLRTWRAAEAAKQHSFQF